jgi:adenylate cyclase
VQLGITPERVGESATIVFSDISNSSELSLHLNEATVIDLVNDYFETLGDVALSTGGAIDKFMGDGFMLTFNVGRPAPDHEFMAIEAALQMQTAFDTLKKKWQIYEIPPLFNRIAIESGRVLPAMMGHWHLKQATVMDEAVNVASALCEGAPRNRNTIVIGSELWSKVSSRVKARELAATAHKETRAGGLRAWEVERDLN